MTDLQEFSSHGMWTSRHGLIAEFAHTERQLYRETAATLERQVTKYRQEQAEDLGDDLEGWIHSRTYGQQKLCEHHRVAAITFLAGALEGFLNFYGIRRFSDKFYSDNLERVGVTEKFCLICVACFGVAVPQSDPAWKALRRVFDARNRLVHPKARSIDPAKLGDLVERMQAEPLDPLFDDAKTVIGRLCALDSSIDGKAELGELA